MKSKLFELKEMNLLIQLSFYKDYFHMKTGIINNDPRISRFYFIILPAFILGLMTFVLVYDFNPEDQLSPFWVTVIFALFYYFILSVFVKLIVDSQYTDFDDFGTNLELISHHRFVIPDGPLHEGFIKVQNFGAVISDIFDRSWMEEVEKGKLELVSTTYRDTEELSYPIKYKRRVPSFLTLEMNIYPIFPIELYERENSNERKLYQVYIDLLWEIYGEYPDLIKYDDQYFKFGQYYYLPRNWVLGGKNEWLIAKLAGKEHKIQY